MSSGNRPESIRNRLSSIAAQYISSPVTKQHPHLCHARLPARDCYVRLVSATQHSVKSLAALALTAVVFVAVWVLVASVGDRWVPARFDMSGSVTRWESKWAFLSTIGAIGAALLAIFLVAPPLVRRVPARAVNLPSRKAHEFWTNPAHRPEFDRRVAEDVEWLGTATLLLLAWFYGPVWAGHRRISQSLGARSTHGAIHPYGARILHRAGQWAPVPALT